MVDCIYTFLFLKIYFISRTKKFNSNRIYSIYSTVGFSYWKKECGLHYCGTNTSISNSGLLLVSPDRNQFDWVVP